MKPVIGTKRKALVKYKRKPSAKNLSALITERNNAQRTARRCTYLYWQNLCHSIQEAADSGNTDGVYEGMKKALRPNTRQIAPLKSSTGNIITNRNEQME